LQSETDIQGVTNSMH